MTESAFGGQAPFIDMIQGMSIVFTQNHTNKSLDIVNGTIGTIHHIKLETDTQIKLFDDMNSNTRVLIPNKPPLVVFVLVLFTDANFHTRPRCRHLPNDFPQDVIPIFRAKSISQIKLSLGRTNKQNRLVHLQPLQFPFVCSVAATVYKVQGRSINTLFVANWKSTVTPIINKPQQVYLIVSRPTNNRPTTLQ